MSERVGTKRQEFGKLINEYIASTTGWIINLFLGLLALAFCGFLVFVFFDSDEYGGWPILLGAFCFGLYSTVISLFYRRGANLKIYERGFEYFSGPHKKYIEEKKFNIIRAVKFQGQNPAIEIFCNGNKFTIQTKWFHNGEQILSQIASMAEIKDKCKKELPRSTIILASIMVVVFLAVVVGVVTGVIK